MRIYEVFHSLQGEGPFTGLRMSFIRTARCHLRCYWCDTVYSFGPGREQSIPSLLQMIRPHQTRYVCLTGGEPLLQSESQNLVRALSKKGYTTVIETSGSLDVQPYLSIPQVVLSVDVKCPSSTMHRFHRWNNTDRLRSTDVIKFVVGDRRDYLYARRALKNHPSAAMIVFQPVWGTDAERLAEWVLKDRLDARVLLQQHKILWGDVPGR